jgi:16S rRNA (adenine1518-N6/adenine1519-N6)-dimethyltransferase
MEHKARKRFGQNFLSDHYIISQIVHAIAPKTCDHLVEIGPGLGAITLPLLPKVKQLTAIELDRDIIPILQKKAQGYDHLTLYECDILQFHLSELTTIPHSLRIIGNLPYNISTPVLFHLFEQKDLIQDMHFMLQKEVALRLVASPGSKQYGRLTIMAGYHCGIELLLDVPPNSFNPAPKVDSCFIRLIPHPPPLTAKNLVLLDKVVKQAFSMRRKTISNALKTLTTKEQLLDLDIDPSVRPEDLAIEQFVQISNILF